MSGKREPEDGNQRDGRIIPIHVRFVPKDIWIRLHIDSRSTIGSVKDAVLERIKMPPFDPTVLPGFYEEARYAMIKPAYHPAEARAFPKAYMGRVPKRSVAEVMEAESKKIIGRELWDPVKSSPSKYNSKSRLKGASTVAQELLGGDAGEGGVGSMSYIGDQTSIAFPPEPQEGEFIRSRTTSKLLNTVRGARSPRLKASMLSLGATAKEAQKDLLSDPTVAAGLDAYVDETNIKGEESLLFASYSPSTSRVLHNLRGPTNSRLIPSKLSLFDTAADAPPPINLSFDPTVDAGLDAYADYLPVTMVIGNSQTKRREDQARLLLEKADDPTPAPFVLNTILSASPKKSRFTHHRSASISSSIHDVSLANPLEGPVESRADGTDLELDDSSTDGESIQSRDKGATTKSLISSSSDLSISSMMNKSSHAFVSRLKNKRRTKGGSLLGASASMSDINSLALSNVTTAERSKVGASIASQEDQSEKSSARMMRMRSDLSVASLSRSASLNAKMSSKFLLNQGKEHAGLVSDSREVLPVDKDGAGEEAGVMSNSSSGGSRIAGIQLDEISSWKDAQHALSKCFSVFSYSNGHMLDDWRTVAAFRLRPFELLEIQYSSSQERIHLPRRVCTGGEQNRLAHRPSTGSLVDMDGIDYYCAPCCEGWCYVFKRNSGNNKAQRAGLGVWKLRYISVRGLRLVIYKKKPARSSFNDAQDTMMWNTDAIKCVFSERADGWTRPALMPLQGLSRDIVTLVFTVEASPPVFVNNETLGWASSSHVSLSLRFVSQLDTCAFFNTFARATTLSLQGVGDGDRKLNRDNSTGSNEFRKRVVTRAIIAGRGGSVLPGRAGREGGRNALARSRCRPSGISREFDDVDRWSSHSEEEGNDKIISTKNFKYTDLHAKKEHGSSMNLKDAFFDPSYKLYPIKNRSSLQDQDHLSPRGAAANLVPEELQQQHTIEAASMTPKSMQVPRRYSGSNKPNRGRGFSFAKAARKALSPSEPSFHSLHGMTSIGTPMRTNSTSLESRVVSADNSSSRKRRSTQPDLNHSAETSLQGDDSAEYAPPSSSSEQRTSTPSRLSSIGGNNTQQSQQGSSPTSSLAGRNRSYTLASSATPPPSTSQRRSIGMRKNSSSSSSGAHFHWPFRTSRNPLAVDQKKVSTDDVAAFVGETSGSTSQH